MVSAAVCPLAIADETDQFLVWDVELEDSTDAINEYLNRELSAFAEIKNASEQPCDCPQFALDYFDYIFAGRLTARFKDFIRTSEDVDVFPPRSVSNFEYNRMSIYRGIAFPFILPMAPTLRVGDVYFGDDKFGHVFGLGKRYYRKYLNYLDLGMSEAEATDRVIRWGILSENTLVGAGIDGIFSHADLEANYEGLRMARRFCEGNTPYVAHDGTRWQLRHEIDIGDYVNPYFDESYNVPHFWGRRRDLVPALIRERYAQRADHPLVIERFKRYEQSLPASPSVNLVRDYFLERGRMPQREQVYTALDLPPDYPITILASFPVP
jgi:hypothetical protein